MPKKIFEKAWSSGFSLSGLFPHFKLGVIIFPSEDSLKAELYAGRTGGKGAGKFMYDYRKLTLEEQWDVVQERRGKHQPWHSPPHRHVSGNVSYLVTAACYEHVPVIGQTSQRMSECEEGVLEACREVCAEIHAWCILPNHYYLLVQTV